MLAVKALVCNDYRMNIRDHRDDDDDPPRPPRPWRLYWILAAVLAFLALAGGGIALGAAGLSAVDGSRDEAPVTETPEEPCGPDREADEDARLCYPVPDGWTGSPVDIGLGPSSSLLFASIDGISQAHFGPLSSVPVDLPTDPPAAVDALTAYACEQFGAAACDPSVETRDIDGRAAVTASVDDGQGLHITVTIVNVTDDASSYAVTVVDEPRLPDAAAIHDGLGVLT